MIIVSDRLIKFFSFFFNGMEATAVAFFPFIICGTKTDITPELINHERIHLRQQLEMLLLPFYIWYFIEYYKKGYMGISFEREAYDNEDNLNYLKNRPIFNFRKYL